MKLPCITGWLWVVIGGLSAQATKYFEVGQKLTLEPKESALPESISSIRWKFASRLVADWNDDGWFYYGPYQNRATLEKETLRLEILRLALNDTGVFSLETNNGPVGTYEVEVLEAPTTPTIKIQPLVCTEGKCALKCAADADRLGPVVWEWRRNDGEWSAGDQVKKMSVPERNPEIFYCRLRTRVRSGNESIPVHNPLNRGSVQLSPAPVWVIVIAVISVFIAANLAVVALVVLRPANRCSKNIINTFNRMRNPGRKTVDTKSSDSAPIEL